MTVVFTCLHPDYIIQISDRRMTFPQADGTLVLADDNANKAVLFQHHYAFSFAGLGKIGSVPTDKWIANTIKNANHVGEALNSITSRATEDFKKFYSKQYFHEFIGAGWGINISTTGTRTYIPVTAHISNGTRDENGYPTDISHKFALKMFYLNGETLYNFSLGGDVGGLINKSVHKNPKVWWDKQMAKLTKRRLGPQPAIRLMTEELHNLADKNPRKTIGKNLLAIAIPKIALLNHSPLPRSSVSVGTTLPDLISSYWISPEGTFTQYGPIVVEGKGGFSYIPFSETNLRGIPSDASIQAEILSAPENGILDLFIGTITRKPR